MPRITTFRHWQAYALRSRTAYLYRITGDGEGGWIVTRPGTSERLHFPTHDCLTSAVEGCGSAETMQDVPPRDAQTTDPAEMTHADQWDAAVRGSHPDFN